MRLEMMGVTQAESGACGGAGAVRLEWRTGQAGSGWRNRGVVRTCGVGWSHGALMLTAESGRRGGMTRKRRGYVEVAEFAAALAGILLLVLAVSLSGQQGR